MNHHGRRFLGGVVALSGTLGLVWLSRAPYHAHPESTALIRLAWSARPERIETCRTPTEDELARLPAYMREREICEGSSARYRLRVMRNGELVLDRIVRGAGLRHDRPLYLLHDLVAPPGPQVVEVRFERIDSLAPAPAARQAEPPDTGGLADHSDRRRLEAEEHRRRRQDAVPPSLDLVDSVTLRPREVLLVTYHADSRRLVTIRAPGTAEP